MSDDSRAPTHIDAAALDDDALLQQLGYKPELKRTLGQFSSFAIQFGTIAPIGGIVFTIGIALAQVGPATIWPWVVAGALQMLIAFIVAEACSSYPVAGAAYDIISRLGGRFLGWQAGWWLQIAHVVSLAGSCVAIAPIISSWFGFTDLNTAQVVGVTGALILAATLINLVSVRVASGFVNAGAVATVAACILVTVILAGAMLFGDHEIHGVNYLFTTEGTVQGSIVLPLLFAALLPCIVLNAFDVSGNASEETKHASRAVPRAMVLANIGSYVFGTVVILLLVLNMTSTQETLEAEQPVTSILAGVLGAPVAKTFEVLAVLGLYVSGVVLQMAGARILWAQARDNEFPLARHFSKLNREKVPALGVVFGGVAAFLLVLWSSLYAVLIAMTVVLWVVAYAALIACLGLGKLRGVVPTPAFKVWNWRLLFVVALVWSAVVGGVLIYQDPVNVGLGVAIILALGVAIYFLALPKGRRGPAEDAPADSSTTDVAI